MDEILIRRYLLGDLGEEEQSEVEQRLLTDRRYARRLRLVEDDLAMDYLDGKLSDAETKNFKEYFLRAPERRDEVALTAALSRYADPGHRFPSQPDLHDLLSPLNRQAQLRAWLARNALSAALAAALVLTVVSCVWLLLQAASLRRQIAGLREQQPIDAQRVEQLERQISDELLDERRLSQQVEDERARRLKAEQDLASLSQGSDVQSLVLIAGMTRADRGGNTTELRPHVNKLRFTLILDEQKHDLYRAEIRTANGALAWQGEGLPPRRSRSGRALILTVPTRVLSRGNYKILVGALSSDKQFQALATYLFTIK